MTTTVLAPPSERITAERFDKIDNKGYELVDGKLLEKGMGIESSAIQSYLNYLLQSWVRSGGSGVVLDSEGIYRCFPNKPDQTRKPDVSFIRKNRLPVGRYPHGVCQIPPDLVVEVISPNEIVYDLNRKLADYQSVAVPLIWVVHPDLRVVDVYIPGQPVQRLMEADTLTGDPVLPGFRVRVAELFPSEAATVESAS
ncbi:MAG: Uma2 family endonuclease [Bacteroidales bacterium]|nr:Uma2 family endonuclease [Bacteroidales bacterium]